ncbi:hypothetical protein [Pseudomonas phage Misse]|uniref:Uncharacterized protein n=1 Tax=Pseudomonas phage Bertil TaxID=2801385 RepID=A0A7T8IWC1_9CAUD|nr:hypothetical protein [Pseudomonas phage Bertil]QQO90849.1 hypothetical protein [Pseudomonas phage Misse]QQO90901.1 hypothetical protein [Pseudomonas phage Strit]
MSVKPEKVEFTRRQLDYLERMFPEFVGGEQTTHAQYLLHSGKRQVVLHIRQQLQKDHR